MYVPEGSKIFCPSLLGLLHITEINTPCESQNEASSCNEYPLLESQLFCVSCLHNCVPADFSWREESMYSIKDNVGGCFFGPLSLITWQLTLFTLGGIYTIYFTLM